MKTRTGFVSNSSTSSFIVPYIDRYGEKIEVHLSKGDVRDLKKFGFRDTIRINPFNYAYADYIEKFKRKALTSAPCHNLGYEVTCNQDDVIYFLLKNNISFTASCHYDHYLVKYEKGKKYFYEIDNLGNMAVSNLRFLVKSVEEFKKRNDKPIRRRSVEKYLKEMEEWYIEDGRKRNGEENED